MSSNDLFSARIVHYGTLRDPVLQVSQKHLPFSGNLWGEWSILLSAFTLKRYLMREQVKLIILDLQ